MIRHIVIVDAERGMTKKGGLPYDLPQEFAQFKRKTGEDGGNVLMGAKTYEAIGRPMIDRHNYIVSRREDLIVPGSVVVHDLKQFLATFEQDLWIIGGSEIFAQTMDVADELYITEIAASLDCDQFYPAYKDSFELAWESEPQHENGVTYRYTIYRPIR